MFNGASPTYIILENVGGLYLSRYGLQSSSMGYGGLIDKSLSLGILALHIYNGHELRLSILQAPSYRCLFFVYHVLKVMLAPLFLRLFSFQWQISSTNCYSVCCINYIISIKRLVLFPGFLCSYHSSTPYSDVPSPYRDR